MCPIDSSWLLVVFISRCLCWLNYSGFGNLRSLALEATGILEQLVGIILFVYDVV